MKLSDIKSDLMKQQDETFFLCNLLKHTDIFLINLYFVSVEVAEGFVCPDPSDVDQPGLYSRHAHPTDCRKFYVCIEGTARPYGCSLGTVFNVDTLQCDEPENVPGWYVLLIFCFLIQFSVDFVAFQATTAAFHNIYITNILAVLVWVHNTQIYPKIALQDYFNLDLCPCLTQT